MWPERTPLQAETGWIKEAPSNEEAIEYVTMKQVERGHWSNEAKEYYYAKRAAALGVRERGKTWVCRSFLIQTEPHATI